MARIAALSSLRTHLQAAAAGAGPERAPRQAWALQCICELAPPAAAHVHRLLGPAASEPLDQAQIQVGPLQNPRCLATVKRYECEVQTMLTFEA